MRWQSMAAYALALMTVAAAGGPGLRAEDKKPSLTSELILGALKTIAEDPKMIGRALESFDDGLPNLVAPTLGGHTWWKNVDTHKGWKLQQNTAFGNYRILDPNDYRFAWGGEAAMAKVFAKMKANGMVIYNPEGVPEVGVGKWTDLGAVKGWTLQRNTLSKHVRIRDENSRTVAIGHEESVAEFLNKLGTKK